MFDMEISAPHYSLWFYVLGMRRRSGVEYYIS